MMLGFERDPFDLDYSALLGSEAWLPGHRGWVLAPGELLSDPHYAVIDLRSGRDVQATRVANPLWERQGFGVARYGEPEFEGSGALLTTFRTALVLEEMRVLGAAAQSCADFLNKRESGGHALARHPAVMQMHARLVRDVYMLKHIDVELPLTEAREGFQRMLEGRTAGKIVFTL